VFVYEVNLEVQGSVSGEFRKWLPEHIKHVTDVGEFLGSDWWERDGSDSKVSLWTVRYYTKERDVLDRYLTEKAPALRQAATDLFGDQFKAERRIARLIEIF
jgi:hypothetical protein